MQKGRSQKSRSQNKRFQEKGRIKEPGWSAIYPAVLCLSIFLALPFLAACTHRAGSQPPAHIDAEAQAPGKAPGRQKSTLDKTQIRENTEYLCDNIGIRAQGSAKERETAQWILERLTRYGFSQQQGSLTVEEFSAGGKKSRNIEAVCNRDETGEGQIICVTAHYDSVPDSPGAQDNGASIGILLNMAQILGPEDPDYSVEIRLLFLGAEENGYHGSMEYVKGLSEKERGRLRTVFNMDISAAASDSGALLVCNTLGGNTEQGYAEGDIFEPAVNKTTIALQDAYRELYDKNGSVPVFHYGDSDHLSFHQAGIEAALTVMIQRIAARFLWIAGGLTDF